MVEDCSSVVKFSEASAETKAEREPLWKRGFVTQNTSARDWPPPDPASGRLLGKKSRNIPPS